MFRCLSASFALLALSTLTIAQPLADRVPVDAVAYVGWAGSTTMDGFAGSHLEAVMAASDAEKLFGEFIPNLLRRVSDDDPEAVAAARSISSIARPMWRYPTAFYFGGVDFSNPRQPMPSLAILCQAGADSDALLQVLNDSIHRLGEEPAPISAAKENDTVVLRVGPPSGQADGGAMLATGDSFRQTLAATKRDNPAAVIYVNVERLLGLINNAVDAGRDRRVKENWPKARDAFGLSGAKHFAWTGGFENGEWSTSAFLAAPAPRAGLFTLLDTKPISEAALRGVPSSATMFTACRLDLAALIDTTRDIAGRIDPAAPDQIDKGLGAARMMLGFDLRADLLESLGDEWVFYSDPGIGGTLSFMGVVMNRLDDPAKFQNAMLQLQRLASSMANANLKRQKMRIDIRETKVGDLTIHSLAVPIVRPSWAIKDGVLYAGLYPQLIASAVAVETTDGQSILDNASFRAVRGKLAAGEVTAIRYADLARTAPAMYPTYLLLSNYIGFADLFGVASPEMLMPPLGVLLKHLGPAGSVSWMDDAGWHMRSVSPFPGSELLASDPSLSVAAPALGVSVLLPSLNRSREMANRVKCASNMRQIGTGMLLYANENRGNYPKDLGELLRTQDIGIDVFVCPSGFVSIPPEVRGMNPEQQAKWVNENSPYVYLGAGKNNQKMPADEMILYERFDDHGSDGGNVLFGDGHVEFVPMHRLLEDLDVQ